MSASYLRRWRLLLLLLQALLFIAAVASSSADCPKPCACYGPTEVQCTFKYLTAIPGPIQLAVERLNLGYNSLTALTEYDLSGLENLKMLMLHSNSIHSIGDRSFQDLKTLQGLKMSFNKVKRINKETFKGLNSLQRLHMDHNHIEFISPEAFYGLTNLQLVHLEGNHLQQIHPDTFITLRHSQVFKVSSVRSIHLSDNLLTTLPANIFTGCSHLENLFLHGNPWTCDCRMEWFSAWAQRNPGVLKCKRDRRYSRGPLCPMCQNPVPLRESSLSLLPSHSYSCTKPQIQADLKQKNISVDEGDFTPVSPKDFIAPLGSIQMNFTDHFHNDASLSCSVQRPSVFENLTQTLEEEGEGNNATLLSADITSYLVCNIDYDHMQQLWQILAMYSDFPMRLERRLMLTRSPEMVFRYTQMRTREDDIFTNIKADIKATPAWLLQEEMSFQLDRTATTFSTLHIKYKSVVNLRVENSLPKKDRYSWTMIKHDNETKTEHAVLTGGVIQLNCEIQGEPKPLLEWILPDGTKVRAPYSSDDQRIIISSDGKLTVRGADTSDTGVYRCISTNYLDADVLIFRVTILSPDVEENDVNGVQLTRPLGENVFFDCSSSGSPEASVQWILPDHSVLDRSHGRRKVHGNGTLLIEGLTARDRGFYRCLVANHLGVDLLVSQLTLTEVKSTAVQNLENEGSGMIANTESSLAETTATHTETPSLSQSDSKSQETRTVTSNISHSRLRSQGRGSSHGRVAHRRRGPFRHLSTARGFSKSSRRVDPQKFAEFMKRAQGGSRLRTSVNNKQREPTTGLSGDSENGSAEEYNEDHLIVFTPVIKSFTDKPHKDITEGNRQLNKVKIDAQTGYSETDETNKLAALDSTSVSPSLANDPTEGWKGDAFTPETIMSQEDLSPVTVQVPMADLSQETQLQVSGEQIAESETSTMSALNSFTTDSNVTPMGDSPGPVQRVVHTVKDSKSKTTFTEVTTTERLQDEITFHTTQTIKSPNLPAGSTIISQQHIHIIPHKSGKKGGRRRTFHGRRRIIKPSRITDIMTFFNTLKKPSLDKNGNVTVTCKVEHTKYCDEDQKKSDGQLLKPATPSTPFLRRTELPISAQTEQQPGVSRKYITTPKAPIIKPTINTFLNEHTEPSVSTMSNNFTTASKVIRGRIPWNRLFGSKEREKIFERLKKPYIPQKVASTTTAETTTTTITAVAEATTTTENSPTELDVILSIIPMEDKEGSIDDVLEEFSSGGFEFPTLAPFIHYTTSTVAKFYSKSSPTVATPSVSMALPPPPTVKTPSVENPEEILVSGSGVLPDNGHVSRQRPGWTRRQQGRRRRPFRGRGPFGRLSISKTTPTTPTTVATSTVVLTDHKSKEDINSYNEFDWNTSNDLKGDATTKTPLSPSTSVTQFNTIMETTTVGHDSDNRPTARRHNGRKSQVRRIRPTEKSSAFYNPALDTVDNSKEEQQLNINPTPSSNIDVNNAYDSSSYFVSGIETTSASTNRLKPTPKVKLRKPKIIGGNAASFTVLFNSDVFLPCEAVGDPQPTIKWMRFSPSTGSTITLKREEEKFEVMSNGTLVIQNASIKDRGQYLCIAENDHGSDKLFVTLSVLAYPARILEPKFREVKTLAGNTVKLTCEAEGRPTPTVSWTLANQTQVDGHNAGKGRVSVNAEGTLNIEQVSVSDRGLYKCIASNPAGSDTATVRLQVVAAPPGIIEEKRQLVKARVGQSLWLPCTGKGSPPPRIHWVLHDGSELQWHTPTGKFFLHQNGTLNVKDVTDMESGTFECIATSSTGSERRVVVLTIERQESAPQIVEISQPRTELSFGDQLTLNCSATGEPKPRIMWRLPSRVVVDQSHRMGNRIEVLHNGTLIVSAVSEKDNGNYLCVARNKISDDFQLMRVSVSMKPAKIEEKPYEKKQVAYGNDVKVDCKASGAPKPEISWSLPDGTMVSGALQSDFSSGGGRARRYTLFDNGTLFLNEVGISEEGDYTCYAENKVGKDEMIVHISVMTTSPKIRPFSQTFARVKPGGSVRFDCEAVGEPKPKILWTLPNNDVIAASNERYLIHVNGSLDIRDVKVIDAGEYVCMARNPAGETRKLYELDIDGNPPVINGYRQNRTVLRDVAGRFSRKLLHCKAEGNPTPSITWIMPDNIFLTPPYFSSRINVHLNGTLEIRNVRPTDSGEFMCLARNDGGEAVMVVQLEVTSMLRRPIFKNPFNKRVVSHTGKKTVLNCSANGHPVPEIIWTLPNGIRLVGENNQSSHYYASNNGSLIIHSLRKEDAGKYRCGARNFMGYIEKLFVLDIGQEPHILTRPRGIIRSMLGEPLFLHCLSDGSPKPRVHWTAPSGHAITQPRLHGRYRLLENGTLIIQDTTLHDRGNYVCRARNDAGEAVLTVPVLIIAYPPRITALPTNVRAVAQQPVRLTCAAVGIPKPEVSWELPDHSIFSAAQRSVGTKLHHPHGTLLIQRPSAEDSGTYKCHAKNHLGTDSKVTYVHVL